MPRKTTRARLDAIEGRLAKQLERAPMPDETHRPIDDTDRIEFLQLFVSAVHFHPTAMTTTVIDVYDVPVSAPTFREAVDESMRIVAERFDVILPFALRDLPEDQRCATPGSTSSSTSSRSSS
jgi:hypothetical protein